MTIDCNLVTLQAALIISVPDNIKIHGSVIFLAYLHACCPVLTKCMTTL